MRTSLLIAVIAAVSFPSARAAAEAHKPPATVAEQLEHDLGGLEREFVPAAEAMPDGKYDFAPTQGEFKGVRTFAQEVKHVAHTNFLFFAALLGEKLPANVKPDEENGPDAMRGKAEILKYLKDSFAMGHRAMRTLVEGKLAQALPGMTWTTRLGGATLTVWHSYDHYGQMVEYLRMNGIVPPASRPK